MSKQHRRTSRVYPHQIDSRSTDHSAHRSWRTRL